METTGKALVDHWSWAAKKGLMNRNTSSALRAACSQVLGVLDDWETVDINELDIDSVINRFENLRGRDFKTQTLAAYGIRFRRAVQSFQEYIRNPSSWSPTKSSTTSSGRSRKKSEPKPPETEDRAGDEGNAIVEPTGLVKYPFPLRQDTIAILHLPNDLTFGEVERLNTFMQALVVEF